MAMLALASCNVNQLKNYTVYWNPDWTTSIKLLSQVYNAKVSAEIVLLKPTTQYQKVFYDELKNSIKKVQMYLNKAKTYELQGNNLEAALYYLAAFDYAYYSLKLISFMKIPDLTQYSYKLTSIGELLSATAFSSYKIALKGTGCANTSKVVYVFLYTTLKNAAKEVNNINMNLPNDLTPGLAHKTVKILKSLSNSLTYEMAQYYLSIGKNEKDVPLPNKECTCPKGIGHPFPWLPKACCVVESASPKASPPQSPCAQFFIVLAHLINDTKLLNVMCSLG